MTDARDAAVFQSEPSLFYMINHSIAENQGNYKN